MGGAWVVRWGLVLALLTGAGPAVAVSDLPVVEAVDTTRYQGRWYEIARLPNFFQRKCAADVFAEYRLLDGGRIGVRNQCAREDGRVDFVEGVARRQREDGPDARLEVSFLPAALRWVPFTWGDYWIIELGPDYDYSVVGTPNRKYLWILSRAPAMDEERYQGILARVATLGFDASAVVRTVQRKP